MSWARRRAFSSGKSLTITRAFVQERLERGVCEVSGLPFVYEAGSPFAPSLDRRDNSQGYTPDNTQVVVLMYNMMKSTGTHTDALRLAEALCIPAKK